MTAPGWYPSPDGKGTRWWDGHQWTTTTQQPARGGRWKVVLTAVVLTLVVLVALGIIAGDQAPMTGRTAENTSGPTATTSAPPDRAEVDERITRLAEINHVIVERSADAAQGHEVGEVAAEWSLIAADLDALAAESVPVGVPAEPYRSWARAVDALGDSLDALADCLSSQSPDAFLVAPALSCPDLVASASERARRAGLETSSLVPFGSRTGQEVLALFPRGEPS